MSHTDWEIRETVEALGSMPMREVYSGDKFITFLAGGGCEEAHNHIVKCVNNFDALVDACEYIADWYGHLESCNGPGTSDPCNCGYSQAVAALEAIK